ncbi:MAG: DinB family protein [Bryobacteraceae bacterium]
MRTLLFALSLTLPILASEKPTDLDREHLIAHFEMTESWLVDEVSHLSPAQLTFRAAPGTFSVLDCIQHLNLSEPGYWATFQREIKNKPTKDESPSEDIARMWYGIDRTEHAKTPPAQVPALKSADLSPVLGQFRALRATMLQYIRTTQDDWRHHMVPNWDRDTYQWLLMISAHSQRHILQLREVKHNPNFPKQ